MPRKAVRKKKVVRRRKVVLPGHRGRPVNAPLTKRGAVSRPMLSVAETEGFLYEHKAVKTYSSNVASMQYFPEDEEMVVTYLPKGRSRGGKYVYTNVPMREAQMLIDAASKGEEIWSLFRVRGSATAHKKPFFKLG